MQHSHTLDPLATVRRHPEWYFRGGQFDADEALGLLVAEARRGGAEHITVSHDGGAVVVAADIDWLDGDLAAFVSPQNDAAGGRNSSRVEVALVAFCPAVATATGDEDPQVWSPTGHHISPADWAGWNRHGGRVVAFWPPSGARRPSNSGTRICK